MLEGTTRTRFRANAEGIDLHVGLTLTLIVDPDRASGFEIPVRVTRRTGHAGCLLEVLDVMEVSGRRRSKRGAASQSALIRPDDPTRTHEFDAHLLDISKDGIAFISPHPAEVGEELECALNLQSTLRFMRVRVTNVSPYFGRWLVGCTFTRITDADRTNLDAHAHTNPMPDRRHGAESLRTTLRQLKNQAL